MTKNTPTIREYLDNGYHLCRFADFDRRLVKDKAGYTEQFYNNSGILMQGPISDDWDLDVPMTDDIYRRHPSLDKIHDDYQKYHRLLMDGLRMDDSRVKALRVIDKHDGPLSWYMTDKDGSSYIFWDWGPFSWIASRQPETVIRDLLQKRKCVRRFFESIDSLFIIDISYKNLYDVTGLKGVAPDDLWEYDLYL